MEKLWTTHEVAQYLGIAEADVEQLVREGKLTGYKLGGQFLRFRPSQVETLKGTLAVQPAAAAPQPADTPWIGRVLDFLYFHDLYVASGALLVVMVLYLVVAW